MKVLAHARHRLRTRRVKASALDLPGLCVRVTHPEIGLVDGELLDLSKYGLAALFAMEEDLGQQVLPGDRIFPLQLRHGSQVLFEGGAVIRRIAREASGFKLGIELESDWFEILGLHRLSARLSFHQRWERAQHSALLEAMSPEFLAWVVRLRTYLEETACFLDEEEKALAPLDRNSRERQLQDYLNTVSPGVIQRMNQAEHELQSLVGHLNEAQHETHRYFFRRNLVPLLARSPFLKRAFDKPLAYAGDYEMMNMLYREHAEGQSLFAQALNLYATQAPVAQANINRIAYVGAAILRLAERHPYGMLRIISVGCGPAQEIRSLLEQHPELGPRLDISLIDQGEQAIAYCEHALAPLMAQTGATGHFIRENIRGFLTLKEPVAHFGRAHMIYSSGLFDYLGARAYKVLAGNLYRALQDDGEMILGNVAAANPSRWAMEYLCDWFVIHRSPEELLELAQGFAQDGQALVDAEPSGVNLFLKVRKPVRHRVHQ
jgi:extracellular factor (EF) 3-hydroxypalmitic acid methyl ester biosynthesis protein